MVRASPRHPCPVSVRGRAASGGGRDPASGFAGAEVGVQVGGAGEHGAAPGGQAGLPVVQGRLRRGDASGGADLGDQRGDLLQQVPPRLSWWASRTSPPLPGSSKTPAATFPATSKAPLGWAYSIACTWRRDSYRHFHAVHGGPWGNSDLHIR